jgi:hypothetical protein
MPKINESFFKLFILFHLIFLSFILLFISPLLSQSEKLLKLKKEDYHKFMALLHKYGLRD